MQNVERGGIREGQGDMEEGGGVVRRQAGGGGVKRKKQDEDYRDSGRGEGKTPRKSPGTKRNSPPGPRIKPKHKEAPQIKGGCRGHQEMGGNFLQRG